MPYGAIVQRRAGGLPEIGEKFHTTQANAPNSARPSGDFGGAVQDGVFGPNAGKFLVVPGKLAG
jgi:hypothetical protein